MAVSIILSKFVSPLITSVTIQKVVAGVSLCLKRLRSRFAKLMLRSAQKISPKEINAILANLISDRATSLAVSMVRNILIREGFRICGHQQCVDRFQLKKGKDFKFYCQRHQVKEKVAA